MPLVTTDQRATTGLLLILAAITLCFAGVPLLAADDPLPLGTGVRCVAFSADGRLLAATHGEPKERGRVVLWEVAGHKQLWSHGENHGVPAVAFSPDGKSMAIGNYDNLVRVLDTHSGRTLKELAGHTNYARAVAFSPDGKTLASGGWDNCVKLWEPASGVLRATLDFPDQAIFTVSFSRDGHWLLGSGQSVRVWDVASGKEKRTTSGESAVFLDDQWYITLGNNGSGHAWNVATGQHQLLFREVYVSRLACSPAARRLAVARQDISFFDFPLAEGSASEKERFAALLVKLDDDDYSVREATGVQVLAMGLVVEPWLRHHMKDSPSAEVRIRCRRLRNELLKTPRMILSGHTSDVEGLAFSPDGRLLASGSKDGTVRLWNVQEGKEIRQLVPQ